MIAVVAAVVVLLLAVSGVVIGFALNGDDEEGDSAGDDSSQSPSPSESDSPALPDTSNAPPSPSAPSSAPEPPSEPVLEPVVGECHALTTVDADATSDDSPAVDCATGQATSQTIFVGSLDSQDDAALNTAGSTCYRQVAETLGVEPRLIQRSLVSWVFFRASDEQWESGARYFRCDLVLADGPDTFLPLPGDLGSVYSGAKVDPAYEACLSASGVRLRCADPQAFYEWTGSFNRTGIARRPADEEMLTWAKPRCVRLAGGQPPWYSTWAGEESWADGWRTVTCWQPRS